VLTGVEVRGRVQGALFAMTLRQTYCNTSARTLEVIYTFPLPPRAVLLGMSAQLGDRRLDCEVLPRRRAEAVYEDALADGDAPVLLEAAGDGLHTASIGNLKPAEVMTLEVRMAQPLAFEHGRLRLAVPMTIAPRYGNAADAGVAAHAEPVTSLRAQYSLSLTVDVVGALASGDIECPTHAAEFTRTAEGLRMTLAPAARMDRDVVLSVTLPAGEVQDPASPEDNPGHLGLLTLAPDNVTGGTVALVAFALPVDTAQHAVTLKLVVDCSGSMAGDSIASAREALTGVADALDEGDTVSLTRFGSHTEVALWPSTCTPSTLRALRQAIRQTDATLAGTELNQAVLRVMLLEEQAAQGGGRLRGPQASRLGTPRGGSRHGAAQVDGTSSADILLITDGEVWDVDAAIEKARATGHRIFIIGVGTSAAEGLLRRVADATGGACEFATPGEALEAAAMRMLQRMRQPRLQGLKVDWGLPGGASPAWELPLPAGVFGGDTVLAWAGLGPAAAGRDEASSSEHGATDAGRAVVPERPARLLTRRDRDLWDLLAETGDVETAAGDDLPRIAASQRLNGWLTGIDLNDDIQNEAIGRRMAAAGKHAQTRPQGAELGVVPANLEQLDRGERIEHAQALALAYQLVSPLTHAVLVHRRADQDKPLDEATLHQVEQMLPAGWGGMGSVRDSGMVYRTIQANPGAASACMSMAAPSLWRSARTVVADDITAASVALVSPAAPITDTMLLPGHLGTDRAAAGSQLDSVSWLDKTRGGESVVKRTPSKTAGIAPPFKAPANAPARPHTLAEIAHAIDNQLRGGASVDSLSTLAQTFRHMARLVDAVSDLLDLEPEDGLAWLWLAHWVADRHAASGAVPDAKPLHDHIAAFAIEPAVLAEVKAILDRHLGRVDPTSWRPARAERLAKVLETL
jgi:Ca-activated chloride channel family protein